MQKPTLDTVIVLSKGFAFILIGVFTPWTAALAQWINSGQWPGKIIWIGIILPASVIGGATQWVAFTSGAWKEYRQQKLANDTGQEQIVSVKPNTTGTGK